MEKMYLNESQVQDAILDIFRKVFFDNFKPEFLGEYKIESAQRKSWSLSVAEDSVWNKASDFYELTEWTNGEGWDIAIEKHTRNSQISLHFTDLEAILKLLMTAGAITDDKLLNKRDDN